MTWALTTIAVLLIGYATVSRRLEGLNVSGAMFFTTAGLLVGLLGLVDLKVHGEQLKLLAEITLTPVLFADASRISLRALRHESATPLRLRRERAHRRAVRAAVLHRHRLRRDRRRHGLIRVRSRAGVRADRLRARRRNPRRRTRGPRTAVRRAPATDRATLAANPERRFGTACRRHRDRPWWK